MDYGMVAKMVQNDLCSKGITAANVESAPLLIETYLKTIGMAYNKDDVNAVAGIMTMSVQKITPCNPGSATYVSDYYECGDDNEDNEEVVNCDDEKAANLFEDMEDLFPELFEVSMYYDDIVEAIDIFKGLQSEISEVLGCPVNVDIINSDCDDVISAIDTIKRFTDAYNSILNLVEERI